MSHIMPPKLFRSARRQPDDASHGPVEHRAGSPTLRDAYRAASPTAWLRCQDSLRSARYAQLASVCTLEPDQTPGGGLTMAISLPAAPTPASLAYPGEPVTLEREETGPALRRAASTTAPEPGAALE
jgi:hypothetical protein